MYVPAGLTPVVLQVTGEVVLGALIVAALVLSVLVTVFLAFSPYLSGDPSVHAPATNEDYARDLRASRRNRADESNEPEGTNEGTEGETDEATTNAETGERE